MAWCPSCCTTCFVQQPGRLSTTEDSPYAFKHLLALGTLSLRFPVESHQRICEHHHAEDGWHSFRGDAIISHLVDNEDISLCQELDFLIKHKFATVTCRVDEEGALHLRIYLIPYDLANVQGRLKVRKEIVLGPARKYLRRLLPTIYTSLTRWDGIGGETGNQRILPKVQDSRSLADIYGDLASPKATPVDGYGNICHRLLNFDDDLDGLEMRSDLYKYQRRSVAAMLQKELDLRDIPDPLYIPLQTVHGKRFYLQPGTMEVLQNCPMTASCRGGILCEELGTGKTVMILSLIVATRKQLSAPEPSIVDNRVVVTPLAFRHFPSDFSVARKRFSKGMQSPDLPEKVPSLVELLIHRSRTHPACDIPPNTSSKHYSRSLEIEDEIEGLPMYRLLRASVPFYHHYRNEPSNRERVQRYIQSLGPKKIYLTSATLIVVPANLLSQWGQEITRHCSMPLRTLVVRRKTPLPSVQALASDYDIILMTYHRFSAESSGNTSTDQCSWRPCKCAEFPGSRVPDCHCQIPHVTPLLQIRWKRLVIDEGHVSASLSTLLVPFARTLSVERKWIVTGTPTTNLLGLSFGSKSAEESGSTESIGADLSAEDVFSDSREASQSSSSRSTPVPKSAVQSNPRTRIWNKYDREDLNKLGNMITHFIAAAPFNSDSKLMSTHVIEPLLDPSGPRPGAIQVLNRVMEMVMIRHRIEEIEQDVILPPVTQENVLLDLDPVSIKSYNALQASILVNAIDSERTDQDYLFHPRNTEHLLQTVKNMSQLCFWHVDEYMYNAEDLAKDSQKIVDKAIERNRPEEDIRGLIAAQQHLQSAMSDPLWKAIQKHEDIPYHVYEMNRRIYNAWTRTRTQDDTPAAEETGLMHADRLLKIRETVLQKPLIKEDAMVELGVKVDLHDVAFRQAFQENQRKRNRKKGGRNSDYDDRRHLPPNNAAASQKADNFAKKASAMDTLKEMQQELDLAMANLGKEEEEGGEEVVTWKSPGVVASAKPLPSRFVYHSVVSNVKVGSSASSKLNYIINEVQTYSATEKFLIFSESPLTLAHVAEALELIDVKFLRFTTQVPAQFREQLVLTFETSELYRVFLMELKHGARGLNLVSASRVIFCEPVWQADVESQAIKRAHRIGQTKPISVKTLAIRSTAEENMVARRSALRNSTEKIPKLIEEAGMRHFIANPTFIEDPPQSSINVRFPLFPLPPEPLEPLPPISPQKIMLRIPALHRTSSSPKRVRVEDPTEGDATETPTKKARVVKFASD